MLDKIGKLRLVDGTEYPLAFNLNVLELIQNEYGKVDVWTEKLNTENLDYKCLKWTFMQFINEGIDIENEEKGTSRPFVTEKQVGRLIGKLEDKGMTQLFEIFKESMPEKNLNEIDDPNS